MSSRVKVSKPGLIAIGMLLVYLLLPALLPEREQQPARQEATYSLYEQQTAQTEETEAPFSLGSKNIPAPSGEPTDAEDGPTYQDSSKAFRMLSAIMQFLLNLYRI